MDGNLKIGDAVRVNGVRTSVMAHEVGTINRLAIRPLAGEEPVWFVHFDRPEPYVGQYVMFSESELILI